MDRNEIFLILGIGETKDEEAIKNAYRRKLTGVNPEDDPEGFKRLRQAYEEACVYARQKDEAELRDETPVGLWMEKVEAAYRSLSARLNVDRWKELLSDEVCVNLDTCEEAKKRFIAFVADHYRFTTDVWKLIDSIFAVKDTKQELYDSFPKNFVDYLAYQCEHGDWFPYELLEGDDEADYDLFIRLFFDISRNMEDNHPENVPTLFDEADSLFISHPYMELERARYLQSQGKKEESDRLLCQAQGQLGENDERAAYIAAGVCWGNGKKDEAAGYYKKLLETNPEHYLSNYMLGEYYVELDDYETAKKYAIEAMKVASTQELTDLVTKINKVLIETDTKKLKAQPDDWKTRLDMGWCYLQEEECEEGIKLFEGLTPRQEDKEEYNNLLGKLYYSLDRYEEAMSYIRTWLESLNEQTPKTDKEISDRKVRMSTAHTMLGRIYREKGKTDPAYFEKAMEEIELAAETGKQRYSCLMEKAYLYMDWGKYEECEKICTSVLEEDSAYFPSYITRQEANFKLGNARGVLQDFYAASEIYGGYPRMYELAAEVLLDFSKYDELEKILKQAEENEVSSNQLDIDRAKMMRLQSESREDTQEAVKYLEDKRKEFEENQAEDKDMAGLFCEIALCRELLEQADDALAMINEARKKDPSNDRYLWIKANMMRNANCFEEALKLYQEYETLHPDNDFDNLYYYIGDCYAGMGKRSTALDQYLKALELNPEHRRANGKIARLYTQAMEENGTDAYLEKGLPYATRQLEITDEAYFYVERGLLYMAAGRWEEAIADFKKAIEMEPDNTYAYNNAGCVYKYQCRYEEAVDMLKKAAQVMGETETALPYGNLGDTYMRMGKYEEAVKSYQENIKRFPKGRENYKSLSKVYRYMGDYDRALEAIRKIYGSVSAEYYRIAKEIFLEKGNYGESMRCLQNLVKLKEYKGTTSTANREKALILIFQKKYMMAEMAIKKAVKTAEKDGDDFRYACQLAATFYRIRGKKDKSREYAREAIGCYPEDFLENQYHLSNSLYQLGRLSVLAGDLDKAKEYLERMTTAGRCRGCCDTTCVHCLTVQAMAAEEEGDRERALMLYYKVLEADRNNQECRLYVRALEGR